MLKSNMKPGLNTIHQKKKYALVIFFTFLCCKERTRMKKSIQISKKRCQLNCYTSNMVAINDSKIDEQININ